MADTACVLCGEPWDVHHIRHDEPLYVQRLFYAGKGCPSCQGRRQRRKSEAKVLAVGAKLMHGGDDEDCIERLMMLADGSDEQSYAKEWDEAQEPTVVKTCEGCDCEASFEADDIYGAVKDGKVVPGVYVWHKRQYSTLGDRELVAIEDLVQGTVANGHSVNLTHFDDDWDFETVHDKTLCADCWATCDGENDEGESCEEKVFVGAAHDQFVSDTYDAGSSFHVGDLEKTFCVGCFERLPKCGYCSAHADFGHAVYIGADGKVPEDAPLGYTIFFEEDEYKCEDCTEWKECDECDRWKPPEAFILVGKDEDGERWTEQLEMCLACHAKEESDGDVSG